MCSPARSGCTTGERDDSHSGQWRHIRLRIAVWTFDDLGDGENGVHLRGCAGNVDDSSLRVILDVFCFGRFWQISMTEATFNAVEQFFRNRCWGAISFPLGNLLSDLGYGNRPVLLLKIIQRVPSPFFA